MVVGRLAETCDRFVPVAVGVRFESSREDGTC
jgi:hypothetical protein